MTRPAANEGTLIWASSFTSSLGPKKFSSFSLPKRRHWACSRTGSSTDYSCCILEVRLFSFQEISKTKTENTFLYRLQRHSHNSSTAAATVKFYCAAPFFYIYHRCVVCLWLWRGTTPWTEPPEVHWWSLSLVWDLLPLRGRSEGEQTASILQSLLILSVPISPMTTG